MAICNLEHRYDELFSSLPEDQGGSGRHICAGCAYEKGYNDGLLRKETLNLDLSSLNDSQAGTVIHRSPHAAFALGYQNGVRESYN